MEKQDGEKEKQGMDETLRMSVWKNRDKQACFALTFSHNIPFALPKMPFEDAGAMLSPADSGRMALTVQVYGRRVSL